MIDSGCLDSDCLPLSGSEEADALTGPCGCGAAGGGGCRFLSRTSADGRVSGGGGGVSARTLAGSRAAGLAVATGRGSDWGV